MKIKNKKELILRAKGNVRVDQLVNDSYINKRGREPKVCGIGCLALPHRKREQAAFFENLFSKIVGGARCKDLLEEEFGISRALANLLESLFVGANRKGEAGAFIIGFAEHIPEGVSIDRENVLAFCHAVGISADTHGLDRKTADISWVYDNRYKDALFAWFDNGARVKGISLKEAS